MGFDGQRRVHVHHQPAKHSQDLLLGDSECHSRRVRVRNRHLDVLAPSCLRRVTSKLDLRATVRADDLNVLETGSSTLGWDAQSLEHGFLGGPPPCE